MRVQRVALSIGVGDQDHLHRAMLDDIDAYLTYRERPWVRNYSPRSTRSRVHAALVAAYGEGLELRGGNVHPLGVGRRDQALLQAIYGAEMALYAEAVPRRYWESYVAGHRQVHAWQTQATAVQFVQLRFNGPFLRRAWLHVLRALHVVSEAPKTSRQYRGWHQSFWGYFGSLPVPDFSRVLFPLELEQDTL